MKRTLLRGLTGILLAVAIIVPSNAVPANAFPEIILDKVKDLGKKAIEDLVKDVLLGGGGPSEIELAVEAIIAEIEASKTEIINHIDSIAASDVRACARHHVSELEDIESFSQSTLQSWAQDATACAFLAESRLQSVTSKPAVDEIGFALNVIGPVALAARAKAGFSTTGVMNVIENGNNIVMAKLTPNCTFSPLWGDVPAPPGGGTVLVEVFVQCTIYANHTGSTHVFVHATWGQPVTLHHSQYRPAALAAERLTSRTVARINLRLFD